MLFLLGRCEHRSHYHKLIAEYVFLYPSKSLTYGTAKFRSNVLTVDYNTLLKKPRKKIFSVASRKFS